MALRSWPNRGFIGNHKSIGKPRRCVRNASLSPASPEGHWRRPSKAAANPIDMVDRGDGIEVDCPDPDHAIESLDPTPSKERNPRGSQVRGTDFGDRRSK